MIANHEKLVRFEARAGGAPSRISIYLSIYLPIYLYLSIYLLCIYIYIYTMPSW